MPTELKRIETQRYIDPALSRDVGMAQARYAAELAAGRDLIRILIQIKRPVSVYSWTRVDQYSVIITSVITEV